MRTAFSQTLAALAFCFVWVGSASAQQPDTAKARSDSAAQADSIRLVRELEKMQGQAGQQGAPPARADTTQQPATGARGPSNPRLLPDVSAVGDLVGDLSPHQTTQPDGDRFSVREVELAFQAAVDPYFRGDVFLGVSDLEKISIEQAFLTTTFLPHGLQAQLGRFLMPVGKQNTTHRHDLHTIEYPWVIQDFLDTDGLKGTGLSLSKIFAPFGFYQELIVTIIDRFGETPDDLYATSAPNAELSGLGYSARLRNYWDLSQSTKLEVSASGITGRKTQPLACSGGDSVVACAPQDSKTLGTNVRQSLIGGDVTFRWRPLQQGLYRSFMFQAEVMHQYNESNPALPAVDDATVTYAGPQRGFTGLYAFARYQIWARTFVDARYDWLQDPDQDGKTFQAASGYLEFFPSEFSKLVLGYEHVSRAGFDASFPWLGNDPNVDRILLQASFALGPHKPHPF